MHFEPFWGVLVSALAGFDPDRVLVLYPFLPRWRRRCSGRHLLRLAPVEVLVTLVALGARRPPWRRRWRCGGPAYHAPRRCTASRGRSCSCSGPTTRWRSSCSRCSCSVRASAAGEAGYALGLFLHLLAWAFVLHMTHRVASLAVYASAAWLAGLTRGGALVDVATVFGVNVVIVSPYLYMLFVGYPFMTPIAIHQIVPTSPHLLEVTCSAWARSSRLAAPGRGGIARWRGDRLGRVERAGRGRVAHLAGLWS
mgnify:CR=1 FL=1